jgi:hypothetical protein
MFLAKAVDGLRAEAQPAVAGLGVRSGRAGRDDLDLATGNLTPPDRGPPVSWFVP